MNKQPITFSEWKTFRTELAESKIFSTEKFSALHALCNPFLLKVADGEDAKKQSILLFQEISRRYDTTELLLTDIQGIMTDIGMKKVSFRYQTVPQGMQLTLFTR